MAAFTYERVKTHTGKVQFRADGPSVATLNGRTVRRAEVLAFEKEAFTNALAQTGNYAHVPADTPLGVPSPADEMPPAAPEVAGATAPPTSLTLSIREFLAGHRNLPVDVARRLRELVDAAESTDNIGPNAEPLIAAQTAVLRSEIADEFDSIQAAHPKPLILEEEV